MVHTYTQNDVAIALDVNSGAIHMLSPLALEVVSVYKDLSLEDIIIKYSHVYDKEEIIETYKEIKELVDAQLLFSDPVSIEKIQTKPQIKAMCLHIAHDCNLACAYCFAEEGEYKGERTLMSLETGKKALDFLIENSGERKNLEVDFFGGEPLLNFQVVKELVAYGRKREKETNKKFRFTMTTNGVLLTEDIQDFLNKEMSNIVLSLDGRKEVHDKMRPFSKGSGSYDMIVPRMQEMVQKRIQNKRDKEYYVRGTFTKENMDFSKDVTHLRDLGFIHISMEPVVSTDERFMIENKKLDTIFDEYDKLAEDILQREKEEEDINFFHFMIDFEGGPCLYKRVSGCGAGSEYVAVSPFGELYPCHQFVGDANFLLGNLDEGIVNHDIVKGFLSSTVLTKEACQTCFAKFYCSGGCHANAYMANGTIDRPYEIGCAMQRKRTETAIMMEVKRYIDKNNVL